MDERSRGQRLVAALVEELSVRDLAQLLVNEREEAIEALAIARFRVSAVRADSIVHVRTCV